MTKKTKNKVMVSCPECNKPLTKTGFLGHLRLKHGIADQAELADAKIKAFIKVQEAPTKDGETMEKVETTATEHISEAVLAEVKAEPEAGVIVDSGIAELAEKETFIARLNDMVNSHDTEAFAIAAAEWGFSDMLKPAEVELAEVTELNTEAKQPEKPTVSSESPDVKIDETPNLLERIANLGKADKPEPENKAPEKTPNLLERIAMLGHSNK